MPPSEPSREPAELDALFEAVELLIRDNVDSWRSFEEAASASDGSPMSALFREISVTRFANANALRAFLVAARGERPSRELPRSELHQWWHTLAASARHGNARAMLCAAELSERGIEIAYERVLEQAAKLPVGELIRGQRQHARRHHDEIRDLRERSAAAMLS